MAKNAPTQTNGKSLKTQKGVTFEMVQARAPHQALVDNVCRSFALKEEVDYHAIREITEESVARSAKALEQALSEQALKIHLDRIVGAFVYSASSAADFYHAKVSDARRETQASENDHRDEDRDGIAGYDSKADRAREFAAKMALQAFALLAAAEGAIHAYAEIIGMDWKPYTPNAPRSQDLTQRSAKAELDAFKA